jgi:hypothetical protein
MMIPGNVSAGRGARIGHGLVGPARVSIGTTVVVPAPPVIHPATLRHGQDEPRADVR